MSSVQNCTVLAMDLMENGSLWMGLTRKGKDGKPLFQWNQRYPPLHLIGSLPPPLPRHACGVCRRLVSKANVWRLQDACVTALLRLSRVLAM